MSGGTTLSKLLQEDIFNYPLVRIGADRITGGSYDLKFGYNSAAGTDFEPVWSQSTTYTFRSANATMTISSSDDDDKAAGNGALTVFVSGVDEDYVTVSETATMDGQTEVTLSNQYMIIKRMYVVTTGTGNVNTGDIYVGTGDVTAGVPAVVDGKIDAGEGQSLIGWTVVPANHTYHLLQIKLYSARSGTANLDARFRFKTDGGSWRTFNYIPIFQRSEELVRVIPQLFPEKTIIVPEAKASTGSLPVSVNMEFLDLNNTDFNWPLTP
jgi:hypothetical protein